MRSGERGERGESGVWGNGGGVVELWLWLNMYIERKPFLYGKCFKRCRCMHNVEEHIGDQTLIWVHVVHMVVFIFKAVNFFIFYEHVWITHFSHLHVHMYHKLHII